MTPGTSQPEPPAGECWLRQWTIPIEPGVAAQLLLPWPMTPERWQQFWSVLEAMKPGLSVPVVAGRGTPDGDTQ